jgi:hypothetical protein
MLVAGEPFGHLRDLLLLGVDEGAKVLDRSPRILGRDAGPFAVVAAPAGGSLAANSANTSGARAIHSLTLHKARS